MSEPFTEARYFDPAILAVALAKSVLALAPGPGNTASANASPTKVKKKKAKPKKKKVKQEKGENQAASQPLEPAPPDPSDSIQHTDKASIGDVAHERPHLIQKALTATDAPRTSLLQLAFKCEHKLCRAPLTDASPRTIICPGCGPKDRTRYCSIQHLLSDAISHFQVCGLDPLIGAIDEATIPARYTDTVPYFEDSCGYASSARFRQMAYFAVDKTACDYAIVMNAAATADQSQDGILKLKWPATTKPDSNDMTCRDFRTLLEIAFCDRRQVTLIRTLFVAIHARLEDLREEEMGFPRTAVVKQLRLQFEREFGYNGKPDEGSV